MGIQERLKGLFGRGGGSKTSRGLSQREKDDSGVMVVSFGELSQNLVDWLKRHDRETTYPIRVEEWKPGNEFNIEPGMYCKTNITGDEWDQETELQAFYGASIVGVLREVGRLESGQIIKSLTPSVYETPEGYTILKIELSN